MGGRVPKTAIPEPVRWLPKVRVFAGRRTLANEEVLAKRQCATTPAVDKEKVVQMQSPLQVQAQ